MSEDAGVSRRDLLRGRLRARSPAATPPTSAASDRPLPAVISWLDPAQQAREAAEQSPGAARHALFPLLRPPGALAEADFLETCTRCGDCIEACPHDAVQKADPRLRAAAGSPVIDPHRAACLLCEDFPCVAACEPGALRSEAMAVLGAARVQALDCLNRLGSPCSVCVERCPVPGAMAMAGDVPAVNESLCTGCGQCQHVCPAPQNAILMLPSTRRPSLEQIAGGSADDR